MYLDRILGTKTKVNLLAMLIQNPGRDFVEKELAAECGISLSETNRQISDLVAGGLVLLKRMGKTKVYRINSTHFLYLRLKHLFCDLNGVYRGIATGLIRSVSRTHKLSCVLLVGSAASGTVRSDIVSEPSDIDLVFLVPTGKEVRPLRSCLLRFISSRVSDRYGIACYPMVLSIPQYRKLAAENDPFVLHVRAHGEVLYGQKP